jgi:multiple sugar transport system ATP-binding protein
MTMADRIVLLRDGRIEQAGAPLDLYERPATKYVAGFLGSPSMNFIPAQLVSQGNGLAVRFSDGTSLPLPADRVDRFRGHCDAAITLGVRPEHISRAAGDAVRPGVVHNDVTIDLLQPTGSRTYATFLLGGIETVAELKAHDVSAVNERVSLAIDMNRVVLIDPDSDQVL